MKPKKSSSVLLALVSILAIMLACIFSAGCFGLTYYDPAKACNGYTLISNDAVAKLIDMDGNMIKTWDINSYPAKMFPNGSIMGQGGFGEARLELSEIVQQSWDGEVEWTFTDFEEVDGVMSARVHHDFQRDGNPIGYYAPGQEPQAYGGKVLVLAKTDTLDPEISVNPLLDDVIYEVDWETKEATVLWKASEPPCCGKPPSTSMSSALMNWPSSSSTMAAVITCTSTVCPASAPISGTIPTPAQGTRAFTPRT
jgi:hypothetical protein